MTKNNKTIICCKDLYDENGVIVFPKGMIYAISEDGKTLRYVEDYDPSTGNKLKQTDYQSDGKTVDSIIDYELSTGKKLKTTYYKADGTVDRVEDAS